jgi:DNA-binding transcriptional MerR regulator
MKTYRTGEIASLTGLHPNTIRFYEDIGFIAKPARLPNGYRVFTRLDLEQVRFCRLALRAIFRAHGSARGNISRRSIVRSRLRKERSNPLKQRWRAARLRSAPRESGARQQKRSALRLKPFAIGSATG